MKKLLVQLLYIISISISGFSFASAPEAKRRKIVHSNREAILNENDRVALVRALDENNLENAITILNKHSKQTLEKIIPYYQELGDLRHKISNSTILHCACKSGTEDLMIVLLDNFPSLISLVETNGNTITHTVCLYNRKNMLKLICERYSDLLAIQNNNGYTCLHLACEHSNKELIRTLLPYTHELVISNTNIMGQNPFDIVCNSRNKALVALLLATCPNIVEERKKLLEVTAFHQARISSYSLSIIKLLVQYGADVQSEYKATKSNYFSKDFSCFSDLGLFIARFKELAPIVNKLVTTRSFQEIRVFQRFQKKLLTFVYAHSQLHKLFNEMIQEYQQALPDQQQEVLNQIVHFLKAVSKERNICSVKDVDGNTFLHKAIKLDRYLDCKEMIMCLLGINIRILVEPNDEEINCLLVIFTSRQEYLSIINFLFKELTIESENSSGQVIASTQSL